MEEVVESFESWGLHFTSKKSTLEAWRCWVLCSSTGTRISCRRFWIVRGAVLALARRRRVRRREMEAVVGQARSTVWHDGRLCRFFGTFAPLWPTVAAELLAWNGRRLRNKLGICRAVHKQAQWHLPIRSRVAALGSNSLPLQLHEDVREGSPKGLELIEDLGMYRTKCSTRKIGRRCVPDFTIMLKTS